MQLGFAKAIIKLHPEEKWGWPWARGAPQILGFPYNISATAGASDFKFGMQLGFAKTHDKIIRRKNGRHGPGPGDLPKIWGFLSIFTQSFKLATSNLVHSLGFPRPTIKPHPEEKWAWPWAREAPKYLEFFFNISATAALSS